MTRLELASALRRRHRRLADGGETGAALILVLLIVTVIAIMVGASLSLGDTSIRTTVVVRSQAANAYDAQGAVDAAINALRNNSYNNDVNSSSYPKCFGNTASSGTLVLPNFYPGSTGGAASSAAVVCSPDPNTGAGGGLVPITSANKPGNAILTLSTNPAETGISVKALNNSTPFLVHGGVVSDSNITVSNGTLQSNTSVYAHTGCTGTIVATPAAVCNAATAADPNYPFEPAFQTPANQVPPYRVAPTPTAANCPNGVVVLQPGYYDDAAALNAITNGNGSNPCKHGVWWFKPGTYYFDFHNSSNPLLSGSDVWTVGDGQLVAGTPVNSSGAVIAQPPVPATVPGACQNPIKTTNAQGVQFIFGGDSQLSVSGTADLEICGSYSSSRPPIALYGLKAGTESPVASAVTKLSSVTSADSSWTNAGVPSATVANLVDADSAAASWTKTGSSSQTATFTVAGYSPASTVPAGAVLNSATLTVKYKNSAGSTQDSRTVTITPLGASGAAGTPIAVPLPSTSGTGSQTASVDLWGSGTGLLATAFHSFGYSGASAAYAVTSKHAGTESVDTIQLSLGYTVPAFRGETTTAVPGNCLASTSGCSLLSTPTSFHGNAYIQGTTYAPAAPIDLTLSNITAQVLRFGLICRTFQVKETGSISYIGPVIEIPDDSPGYGPGGTVIYLTAYICEGASTCDTSGKLALRARVYLYDPSGTPSPPSRQITVQSWAMQR